MSILVAQREHGTSGGPQEYGLSQIAKIVLLSEPRTGSTNLFRILEAHPELDLLGEPFNENFVKWQPGNEDYRKGVHDAESLDATVDRIFARYDGFKLAGYQLYGDEVGGLPRSIEEDLVGHLLHRPEIKIIFLRRLNVLQSVVSNLISGQTGVWQKWDLTGPVEALYSDLSPMDEADVRRRVAWIATHVDRCESILKARGEDCWHKIVYEDFYFAEPGVQAEQLRALWTFLGVEPIDPSEVEYYLRPSATKLNSPDTYALVPNIRQVNDECGSDAHGWLFAPPSG